MTRWRLAWVAAAAFVASVVWVGRGLIPPKVKVPPYWPGLAGVTVVNPGRERVPNQTILFADDRIASLEPTVPGAAKAVRLRLFPNRFVLPGLIDLRVQSPPPMPGLRHAFGLSYLAAGVTTVRDVGNFAGDIAAVQRDIDEGRLLFPRLIACGRVLDRDPPVCPQSRAVRNVADADAAVAELATAGAQCVRIQRGLSPPLREAIAAAGAARGLPLVGGAPNDPSAKDLSLLDVTAEEMPEHDLRDLLRRWSGIDDRELQSLLSAGRADAAWLPMLVPWQLAARAGANPASMEQAHFALPPVFPRVIWPAQLALFANQAALKSTPAVDFARVASALLHATGRLSAAGRQLRIGSGTPSLFVPPGLSVHIELENLVNAGLTREQAWAAATWGAGETAGIPKLGRIEAGAPADLLVFREDPIQNPQAIATLEAVVVRGRLLTVSSLVGNVLEHAGYFRGHLYDFAATLWARFLLWRDRTALIDCQLP